MVVSQLPPMTKEELCDGLEAIRDFTHRHLTHSNTGYYMLLCNELKYYTVFIINNEYEERSEDVIFECLNNMGTIRQINVEKDRVECWVSYDDECHMFMLFEYDWGIVPCR